MPIEANPTPACYSQGRYMRWENMHGHPLASRLGRIPAHRLALWEHLGQPTSSQCTWCSYPLPWSAPGMSSSLAYCHVVNVDHLDGDGHNNDPENLVPSCWWCNANREWATALIPDDLVMVTQFLSDVHPAARPDLSRWCEIKYGRSVDMKNRAWEPW